MVDMTENEDRRAVIKSKLRQNFDGKIVRKDLTKKIKEGANVPIYVLEFLLGQYCSSDDDAIIETGVQQVKRILADNFVRPDESQKILSQLRKRGSHTVIDMITVQLDIQKNRYFAQFSNLGLARVPIEDEYPEKYDRLLCGGIWCIVQLDYESVEEAKKKIIAWLEKHPGGESQIRRFVSYYMPTTLKLLRTYNEVDPQADSSAVAAEIQTDICGILYTINTAFQSLQDNLLKDTAMDVSAEISALETVLAQEGLTKDELLGR